MKQTLENARDRKLSRESNGRDRHFAGSRGFRSTSHKRAADSTERTGTPIMPNELFRQGMRRVASAVTVVTTRGPNGERRGVTATAVCSLTVDPPSIMACINRETWVGRLAPESGVFAVNVLTLDAQGVAEAFAGRTKAAPEDRFKVGIWAEGVTGAPILNGALATFDCQLERAVEFASHVILIGRVVRTMIEPEAGKPLLYVDGAYRSTVAQASGA
jgi:flavin reductase (DIM6/NTAB) family NADH-FMN oxidoreductase RutF